MDFWFAIVLIVVVGSLSGVLKSYLDKRHESGASAEVIEELRKQLDAQEERIKNLETILFDLEKERRFDNLSK